MQFQSILAIAFATFSGVIAAPVQERGIVYHTVVKNVVEVVSITSTVWVSPQGQPTPTPQYNAQAQPSVAAVPKPSKKKSVTKPRPSKKPAALPVSSPAPVYTAPTSTIQPPTTAAEPTTTTTPVYTPAPVKTPEVQPSPKPVTETPSTGAGYSGRATYYDPGVGLGSCGQQHFGTEYVVAISKDLFDAQGVANSNNNPLCGRTIKCTRNGASVDVKVVDRCPGCIGMGDLDFSMAAFKALGGTEDEGHFQFEWEWSSSTGY
ncbi:RlpA-like double-psi beta-barrel-protein domain-containing protein-containing protein [Geopyxis carbonaria]|nr:RlpA-like double-psi beta-barrel-protein domain-containing protein-containing protein [Geopyxis carbonaria]